MRPQHYPKHSIKLYNIIKSNVLKKIFKVVHQIMKEFYQTKYTQSYVHGDDNFTEIKVYKNQSKIIILSKSYLTYENIKVST